ncbi:hypothetical protein [Pedobacter sp.]|uniref:hypothetical protein n=1 Tax=Pedobacter sp. TaxID=1411316 RepID=UPI003BAA9565
MKLLIIALTLISGSAIAQVTSPMITDSRGGLIAAKPYGDVTGTPYLYNYWAKGTVKTTNGQVTRDMFLKYDVVSEKLLFQTSKGDSMYFADPVLEFEIMPSNSTLPIKFTNGFPKSENISSPGFLENIAVGKITLYKKHNISTVENKAYSGAMNKTFKPTSATYYIHKDAKLNKISPSKKSVVSLVPTKEKEITEFIQQNNTNFKNDGDLKKLFDFINQLN